ncbi:hypothetical protein [Actinoplanes sp. NPDC049316]|uniref:hypothetical protein n=1 Tax=Actinoplanes sp. NPDC049316 TaxID=3154727 RepID=UPI0034183FD7
MTGGGRLRGLGGAGLLVALVAGGALLAYPMNDDKPAPPGRVGLATAWPDAQRAQFPGNVPDGPIYHPLAFLDAHASVGTAAAPDGAHERLVLRAADGSIRELRRRPLESRPEFGTMAVSGDDLVWTESVQGAPAEVWTAKTSGDGVRRLTRDTGDPVFYGSQWDLVVADGRAWWVAAGEDPQVTQVRSVALTGGPVTVRREHGTWALSAWPWLTDGPGDQTGTTVLRSLTGNREQRIETTGTELPTCGPSWCRVLVLTTGGLARIDAMHPDGTSRRRIAGSTASAAVTDVAILDRFEILSEATPASDLTGTEILLVNDLRADRTVVVSVAAAGAFARHGILWWATGDQDSLVWHTLDLRTV